ncbi:hypothetical protein RZS08_37080, partial [Arthrospira platensis SPKY1]|nr:hypothetical protein [Arthrospira platensis SPKY1]
MCRGGGQRGTNGGFGRPAPAGGHVLIGADQVGGTRGGIEPLLHQAPNVFQVLPHGHGRDVRQALRPGRHGAEHQQREVLG